MYKKVFVIKKGEDRLKTIRKIQNKLLMKHLSIHNKRDKGVQIRIAWKKEMFTGWVSRKDHDSWSECLKAARIKRDEILKKIGKILSVKTIIGFTSSNTGHRGITFRPGRKYKKRGRTYITQSFDIRWWSEKKNRFFMSRVSVRRIGCYCKALEESIRVQKQKEESHKIHRRN